MWTNLMDWFKKQDNWAKLAGAVFGLTAMVTIWMLWTIVSLDMLPIQYLFRG